MSREWIELVDPKSAKPFYANIKTGTCTWDKPKGASFDGKGNSEYNVEWWELYDKKHEMPYYYNTKTKFTDWTRPKGVEIISLIKLQQQTILKNVSRNSIIKYEVKNEDFYDQDEFNQTLKISEKSENPQLSVIIDNSVMNTGDISQVSFNETSIGHSQILPVSMKFEHYKRLSSEIFNHIKTYGIDEYAKKNFMEHRRGIFRRKIPVESLICWSKQSLRKPLLKSSRNYYKDALRSFSLIQRIIGDKSSSDNLVEVQKLLEIGLNNSAIRDEIYCQVCKQLNKNPNFGHIVLGWKLMSVLVVTFPPSRDFEEYLKCFIEKYTNSSWSKKLIRETLGNEQDSKSNDNNDGIKSNNNINNSFNSDNSNNSNNSNNVNKNDNNHVKKHRLSYKRVNSIRKVGGMVISAASSISSKSSKKSNKKGLFLSNNKSVESVNNSMMDDNHSHHSHHSDESMNDRENKNDDTESIDENDEKVKTIQILSKHCFKKLARTCIVGPRGKPLSLKEIDQKMNAAFNFSYFGETLEDIMENQQKERKIDLNIPDIMVFLTNAILQLNGCQTEGIFRVSGDADSITELRYQIEKKNFDINICSDPHVPASLLKLWLRELAEPLIPTDAYESCISIGRRECNANIGIEAWELMNSLPEINRLVIDYMTNFLKVIAKPENQKYTKMTLANLAMVFAPNFLRCPSDNPQIIFENTKYEQAFLRILISH